MMESREELVEKYLVKKFIGWHDVCPVDCRITDFPTVLDWKAFDFDVMTLHKEIAKQYGFDYIQVKWLDNLESDLYLCGFSFKRLLTRVLATLAQDSFVTKQYAKKNMHKFKCDNIVSKCMCKLDGRPCAGHQCNCDQDKWHSQKYLDKIMEECRK